MTPAMYLFCRANQLYRAIPRAPRMFVGGRVFYCVYEIAGRRAIFRGKTDDVHFLNGTFIIKNSQFVISDAVEVAISSVPALRNAVDAMCDELILSDDLLSTMKSTTVNVSYKEKANGRRKNKGKISRGSED